MSAIKKSTTNYFHTTGYGWNFRVTHNIDANITYISRYHTNGHMNSDDIDAVYFQLLDVADRFEAERLIHERQSFPGIVKEELQFKPLTKKGEQARIREIKKAKARAKIYFGYMWDNSDEEFYKEAIESSKINN